MDRYYVVQTQPLREAIAVRELRNQDFETFFPRLAHAPRMRHGKFVVPPPSPLFPKYVFVKLDVDTSTHWRSINGTRGVVRLMSMNGEMPSAVPASAMERLVAAGELIAAETSALPFAVSDPVEFVEGPMTGLRGIVSLCEMDRVTLLLDLLGSQRVVRCAPGQLRYARAV